MKHAQIEYNGQLVTAVILYKFLLWYRVYIVTKDDRYFLGWVPKWKVISTS